MEPDRRLLPEETLLWQLLSLTVCYSTPPDGVG